jgi:hypothetical protein
VNANAQAADCADAMACSISLDALGVSENRELLAVTMDKARRVV